MCHTWYVDRARIGLSSARPARIDDINELPTEGRSTRFDSDPGPAGSIASNAMTRTQTIICFSVREPGAALSPLAIRFECVHISVFCKIVVDAD